MLREATHERERNRRWFSDDDIDLIVWFDDAATIVSFQLCYDKSRSERAITWSPQRGHQHFRVDDGEHTPLRNETPLLVGDSPLRKDRLVEIFLRASEKMDPVIRSFVVARLLDFPVSLGASAGQRRSA